MGTVRVRPRSRLGRTMSVNSVCPGAVRYNMKTPIVPPQYINSAPILWKADIDDTAICQVLTTDSIVVGTISGKVLELGLDGELLKTWSIPEPVHTLLQDGTTLFAWSYNKSFWQSHKANLYDLSGSEPRIYHEVREFGNCVKNVAVFGGEIALCDDKGSLALIGLDHKYLWQRITSDGSSGLFSVDESAVYVGHKKKIVKYRRLNGSEVWTYNVTSTRYASVNSGILVGEYVYAEVGGRVLQLSAVSGDAMQEFVPIRHRAAGVCVGQSLLITGNCPTVIFNVKSGQELYRMNFSGRILESGLQVHSSGHLFLACGDIYCVDVSDFGVRRAVEGRFGIAKELHIRKDSPVKDARTRKDRLKKDRNLRVNVNVGQVLVYCSLIDGRVRARTQHSDYNNWDVLLPYDKRINNQKYYCERLVPSETGRFYRVYGQIRRVGDEEMNEEETPTSPGTPLCVTEKPLSKDKKSCEDILKYSKMLLNKIHNTSQSQIYSEARSQRIPHKDSSIMLAADKPVREHSTKTRQFRSFGIIREIDKENSLSNLEITKEL